MPTFNDILSQLRSSEREGRLKASEDLFCIDTENVGNAVVSDGLHVLLSICKNDDSEILVNCIQFIVNIFNNHCAIFGMPRLPEPSGHKALLAGLVKLLSDERSEIRQHAAWALAVMGRHAAVALPDLIDALKNPDFSIRYRIPKLLAAIFCDASLSYSEEELLQDSLIAALHIEESSDIVMEMLSALGDIGSRSDKAIRSLIWASEHRRYIDGRKWAAYHLGRIGPRADIAVSSLLKVARSKDELVDTRYECVNALGLIGANAADVVPTLIDILNIPHEYAFDTGPCRFATLRLGAASSLGHFGVHAANAVPQLTAALRDRDAGVRLFAAKALGLIGEHSNSAIPALIKALHDPHEQVRDESRDSLRTLASAAVPTAVAIFLDEDSDFREAAKDALRALGQEVVPTILEMLESEDEAIRKGALIVLEAIDAGSFPAVVERLQDNANAVARARLKLATVEGIEVMGNEAVLAQDALETFRRIGEDCKCRDSNTFTFVEMETRLGLPDTTIQDHIKKVGNLFRKYFTKFEYKTEIPLDTAKVAKEHKLLDRGKGKRSTTICYPRGWRAWELACEFLERREKAEAAMRRANRQNG